MTKKYIIQIAREAAKEFGSWNDWDSDKPANGLNGNDPHEEREYWISLVEFIIAAEREAILQISRDQWFKTQADFEEAIRARGQA